MTSLVVRAGGHLCALPIALVIETMRPLPIRPIAGVDVSVLGVAVIRGAPMVVVDASQLLGRAGAPSRFVTVRAGSRAIALAVEAVVGVRELAAATLEPLSSLLAADSLSAIGAADAELIVVLRASHCIPEHVARAIEESDP